MDINEFITRDDSIIVLDTNVYLHIYAFSPEYAEYALNCLKKISDKVYVPYMVRCEYDRHKNQEFRKRKDVVRERRKNIELLCDKEQEAFVNRIEELKKLKFPNTCKLMSDITRGMDAIKKSICKYFDDNSDIEVLLDLWDTDKVDDIAKTFTNMVIPSTELLMNVCDNADRRFKRKIPPGYMDDGKKGGIRRYSDLIIWFEVMECAKANQKNVLFVTDDVKEDWYSTENGKLEFREKLKEEFNKETALMVEGITSTGLYEAVTKTYGIDYPSAREYALRYSVIEYASFVKDELFDSHWEQIYEDVDKITRSEIDSVFDDLYEIESPDSFELRKASLKEFDDETGEAVYELIYAVEFSGYSHDYWGRDDDTRETVFSPSIQHNYLSIIKLEVTRDVSDIPIFEQDFNFEDYDVIDASVTETDTIDYNERYIVDYYMTCPVCGCAINHMNDAGDGFCIKCSRDMN